MTERTVGVNDQTSGAGVADVRTRDRTVASVVVSEQYVIPVAEYVDGYVTSYRGVWTSFRTLGIASADIDLFSIINKTGSTKLLALHSIQVLTDFTAVNTAVAPILYISRITGTPTGGTVLTPVSLDTALTHDTNCEAMGATASDGGAATTIAATAGTRGWSMQRSRAHTLVGQFVYPQVDLLPPGCVNAPLILRANEGLLLTFAQASIVTTDHAIVNVAFSELVAAT